MWSEWCASRFGIKKAIEGLHRCTARLVQSVPVNETHDGVAVWEGVVHVFDFEGYLPITSTLLIRPVIKLHQECENPVRHFLGQFELTPELSADVRLNDIVREGRVPGVR